MLRPILIAGCVLLLALPLTAQQQDNSAPQQQTQSTSGDQSQTNPPPPKKSGQQKQQDKKQTQKSSSESSQNPFPEAQSEAAARQTQQQDGAASATQSAAPSAPAPQTKSSSTSGQNPFPEAESEKAQRQVEQQQQEQQKAATPASSESSDSQQGLKGLDLTGDQEAHASDGAGGTVLSPELGQQDTKVGHFYLQSGDYKGAYSRFLEATKVAPGNADAVFGLAEAARHLDQRDQAIRNYQLYLSALPNGPHAKDARKALKDLGVTPKS